MINNEDIIQLTEKGDIYLLYFNCDIIGTANAGTITKIIDKYIESGTQKFILNLQRVNFANSLGINLFLKIKNKIKEKNGDLAFIHVNEQLMKLFGVAGVVKFFQVFESEEEALEYLNR